MNRVTLRPCKLKGYVNIPPSKSVSHRAIICAALCKEKGVTINNIQLSDDISATLDCITALGATYTYEDNCLTIDSSRLFEKLTDTVAMECNESGSTLRFMIPIAAISHKKIVFTGRGRLMDRPQTTYSKIFGEKMISEQGRIIIEGGLKSGKYVLEDVVSSQFVTGLLFALPCLDGDSEIVINSNIESKAYIDITIDVMSRFGVHVENNAYKSFIIKGNQVYTKTDFTVESDFSQAAFFLVANELGSRVGCTGLNSKSKQGDRKIFEITQEHPTEAITLDVSEIPDLTPILAVMCCFLKGQSRIINASRLRIKESDRLRAITTELNKLGANIIEGDDYLLINGVDSLKGGYVDSWGDHRIAMALAIASTRCTERVTITNADCVKKSFPTFWEEFNMLGGSIDGIIQFRKTIDDIDKQLLALFLKRIDVSKSIAEYKIANKLPILDQQREAEVILSRLKMLPDDCYAHEVEMFFKSIMNISRSIQSKYMSE